MRTVFVAVVFVANVPTQEGASIGVKDGGVHVKGWTGEIDAKEKEDGLTLNSAKLVEYGKETSVTTGPATTDRNPNNTAKRDYTVSATFTQHKYMSINDLSAGGSR